MYNNVHISIDYMGTHTTVHHITTTTTYYMYHVLHMYRKYM